MVLGQTWDMIDSVKIQKDSVDSAKTSQNSRKFRRNYRVQIHRAHVGKTNLLVQVKERGKIFVSNWSINSF